jgi:hypothetical protein
MSRYVSFASLLVTALCASACSEDGEGDAANTLSFFVTSGGSGDDGGDLGGLAGADERCEELAEGVGAGDKTWRAYLSTSTENARDRIGDGPWVNAAGMMVAANLTALHELSGGDAEMLVNERGQKIPGQWEGSPRPVEHDIMTGSSPDGMFMADVADATCADWTSNLETPGGPMVGHSDGMGPEMSTEERYVSWNSSHPAPNCSAAGLAMVGGAGRYYCFASD